LLVGIVLSLWLTISVPLSLLANEPNAAPTLASVLLLSVVLLLTPDFAGYWVSAIVLFFVARGIGWLRWWLVVSLLIGAGLLAFNVIAWLESGGTLLSLPLVGFRLGLLLVNAFAIGLMFTHASNAWFRLRKPRPSAA
jgi:hypothetical protein